MSFKKMIILIVAPFAIIAILPMLLSGASEEAAAKIGTAIGSVYGFYAGVVFLLFIRDRIAARGK